MFECRCLSLVCACHAVCNCSEPDHLCSCVGHFSPLMGEPLSLEHGDLVKMCDSSVCERLPAYFEQVVQHGVRAFSLTEHCGRPAARIQLYSQQSKTCRPCLHCYRFSSHCWQRYSSIKQVRFEVYSVFALELMLPVCHAAI